MEAVSRQEQRQGSSEREHGARVSWRGMVADDGRGVSRSGWTQFIGVRRRGKTVIDSASRGQDRRMTGEYRREDAPDDGPRGPRR